MRHPSYRALLLTLAAAAACQGERADDQPVRTATADGQMTSLPASTAEQHGTSMVRMINALPTGTSASVSADARAIFSNIEYKVVTPYTELTDNVARFRLQGAGRDTSIASNNELLMDGSRYTIVTLPEQNGGVRLRLLRDQLATDSTHARLRVIHGVSGVGEIDVFFQGREEPVFDNVTLTSDAGFKDIEALNTTLVVHANGSGKPLLKKEMRFLPGHAYTVVLTGTGQRAEVILVDDRVTPD